MILTVPCPDFTKIALTQTAVHWILALRENVQTF